MSRRAALASAALLTLAALAARAAVIQRYLVSLKLGDTLAQIQQIYPPARPWSKFREPNGVTRIEVERGFSKWFPADASSVRLGLRFGRLAHLQVIYDRDYSRRKPPTELVVDLSLLYGEPRRDGETYFWSDGDSVLAVSYAELPAPRGTAKELRTSLELMEHGYFAPLD